MSRREEYEKRTEELLAPILEENRFELVDVEYVKEAGTWYLRAYVDKEGGIQIDDCELVSRALEKKLDEEDFIEDSYVLEISSPGLGRPLKKDRDFIRSIGREVDIHLFQPVDKSRDWTGVLKDWDKKTVTVTTEDGTDRVFERSTIALIRLAFDF